MWIEGGGGGKSNYKNDGFLINMTETDKTNAQQYYMYKTRTLYDDWLWAHVELEIIKV